MIKERTAVTVLLLALFATAIFFISFANPVWAEEEGLIAPDKTEFLLQSDPSETGGDKAVKSSIHEDPATFKKNYDLTPAQKAAVITECEGVVKRIIKPEMSDMEKYYTLARWANKRAKYDWDFWSGDYDFDYYSHQWDSYGVLKEKSVCVGIAIFYSHLCHAAGLPCKFVRVVPKTLDHTISYIPDINDNAYYIDVTEDIFLMSVESNPYNPIDKDFAGITKEPTDGSFDYKNEGDEDWKASSIKEYYNVPFADWYAEYAKHEVDPKKTFRSEYKEKGSGTGGKHASYGDYPSNYTEETDIWFLDDYYIFDSSEDTDPDLSAIKSKIIEKKFDKQLLIVSGVEKNYDFDIEDSDQLKDAIREAIKGDIRVEYFPTTDESGKIVAKTARLTRGTDYEVTDISLNDKKTTADITLKGTGAYSGEHHIRVAINSAVVDKEPVAKKGLIYNELEQELIEPGTVDNGTILYALGTESEPTGDFDKNTPTGFEAGEYYVWYQAVGDDNYHADGPMQRMERPVTIHPINVFGADITLSQRSFTYNGKVHRPAIEKINGHYVYEGRDYTVTWDDPSSKNAGKYTFTIVGKGNYTSDGYEEYVIDKATNPMKLKGKTIKIKRKSIKKKSKTLKRAKAIKVSKAKGKLSYKLVSAKKGKKSFKKKFKINAKTGKVTVKKRLKKGTYKVKVKVRAKGTANYKASPWKTVTFKVRVR